MPAVLAADSMHKDSKKTPTVRELTKAIAYDKSMFEDTQRSEDEFVEALSRRDDLRQLYEDEQFNKIWKSKKHNITKDMEPLTKRAYLKKKKSKESSTLAPWFRSILNKFKDYGKVGDSHTEGKETSSHPITISVDVRLSGGAVLTLHQLSIGLTRESHQLATVSYRRVCHDTERRRWIDCHFKP